jgi:hypothetical protein
MGYREADTGVPGITATNPGSLNGVVYRRLWSRGRSDNGERLGKPITPRGAMCFSRLRMSAGAGRAGQPVPICIGNCLRPIADPGFREQVVDVALDRGLVDMEPLGDLAVG